MAGHGPTATLPVRFIILTFVGAAVAGALILYFGLTGQLGAAIP
ncbi:MAG TPA: hypothetical protein VEH10_02625 [Thermoplasmata archaeon]|nr:hypothetical protein [Thermoplasmata archaeon]